MQNVRLINMKGVNNSCLSTHKSHIIKIFMLYLDNICAHFNEINVAHETQKMFLETIMRLFLFFFFLCSITMIIHLKFLKIKGLFFLWL
jgi:hypothetical protein